MSWLGASVLMYHHVELHPLEPPPLHPRSYLSPEEFRRQLDLLVEGNFTTWTLGEAAERARGGQALPRRSVVLTFDDGCVCFRRWALPALQERGMRATIFVVTGRLGGTNSWDAASGERRERLLSAEEIQEVARTGVEIGSHGRSHRNLTTLNEVEILEEVEGSRKELETLLGVPIRTFCHPYGHLDERVREAVRAAGYTAAVAIHGKPGAHWRDPYAIPRMIVRPQESPFEFLLKARGTYRYWSRLPRLGILQALHRREGQG